MDQGMLALLARVDHDCQAGTASDEHRNVVS
jgi:hypothetical protein